MYKAYARSFKGNKGVSMASIWISLISLVSFVSFTMFSSSFQRPPHLTGYLPTESNQTESVPRRTPNRLVRILSGDVDGMYCSIKVRTVWLTLSCCDYTQLLEPDGLSQKSSPSKHASTNPLITNMRLAMTTKEMDDGHFKLYKP